MKLYDCRVRHNGNLLHEIPKSRITAREVQLLKHIHGADAIVALAEVGEDASITDASEYKRLALAYSAANGQDNNSPRGVRLIAECFSVKLDDITAEPLVAERVPESEDRMRERLRAEIEAEVLERMTAPTKPAEQPEGAAA